MSAPCFRDSLVPRRTVLIDKNRRSAAQRSSRHLAAALVLVGALAAAAAIDAAPAMARTAAPAAPRHGGSVSSLVDATFQTFRSPSTGRVGKYHIWASGLDTSRSIGLMLQFHGDGAFEFDNPASPYSFGGAGGLRTQAKRHNMILVALRSPDSGSPAWWRGGEVKADYVRDLVEQVVYAHHDIAKDRTWLVGYSGGAEFVTRYLLPKHSSLFRGGGAVLFGGGGKSVVRGSPFDPTFVAAFPMHWYTGASDDGTCGDSDYDALSDAKEGSSFYRKAGFSATLETPRGTCHDLTGRFGPVTGKRLDLRYTS
jgi:predicted peptidase